MNSKAEHETDLRERWYLLGYFDGAASRNKEISDLNWTADRLYAELCRRPAKPFIDPNRPSYADLERIRGNAGHAEQIDAANARRFAQVPR